MYPTTRRVSLRNRTLMLRDSRCPSETSTLPPGMAARDQLQRRAYLGQIAWEKDQEPCHAPGMPECQLKLTSGLSIEILAHKMVVSPLLQGISLK